MSLFPRVTGDGSGHGLPGGRWFELPGGIGFNRWDSRQSGAHIMRVSNVKELEQTLEDYPEAKWNTVSFKGIVPHYASVVRIHIFLIITHDQQTGVFDVIADFRAKGAEDLPLNYEAQTVTMFAGDGRRSMVTTPVVLDANQEASFYWKTYYSRKPPIPSFAVSCSVDTYYFDPADVLDV